MIVLVGGLPGSGKTYFTTKLAARIDAVLLSSDKVRKAMHASGRYDFDDKLKVYRELVSLAETNLLNSGTHVIVDATFSDQYMRSLFIDLAKRYSVKLYFIWLYADEVVVRRRTSVSRKDSEADFAVFEKIRDQADPITMPFLSLKSTDDNIDEMLKRAEDYIAKNERT